MFHFAIFDPTRKMKQLVQLIHTRSKRGQHNQARCLTYTSKSVVDHYIPPPTAGDHFTSAPDKKGEIRDRTYYPQTPVDEASWCTLKMENTLFKVKKSILMVDSCVFMDSKFIQGGSQLPKSKSMPAVIHLPENASQFRDLLWALHHPDIRNSNGGSDLTIFRLLNIAELARKYHFLSFEGWAVEQLHRVCSSSLIPFQQPASASSSSITLVVAECDVDVACARLLKVAYTSRHSSLFLLMIKKLVVQCLWHDFCPGTHLVETIETLSRARSRYQRHVQQLLGVVYYRMLVDMKYMFGPDKSPVVLFPENMDVERRMGFLAAHKKLTKMWEDMKHGPPEVNFSGEHARCQRSWDRLWEYATRRAEHGSCECSHGTCGHRRHTADVLGLLKSARNTVSHEVEKTTKICMECSLAGMESMDTVRDDIINALGDMFVYC